MIGCLSAPKRHIMLGHHSAPPLHGRSGGHWHLDGHLLVVSLARFDLLARLADCGEDLLVAEAVVLGGDFRGLGVEVNFKFMDTCGGRRVSDDQKSEDCRRSPPSSFPNTRVMAPEQPLQDIATSNL